ncbi:MAG: restriction endonuclease subunit S [Loktanella sp.]|nr:restriction endonuclease subunit S [Loktanella sp.]
MKDVAKVGWETRQLGEVCKLVNGRAYKKPELLDNGPYPVLRVGNFFTNNHWYYSDLELDADKYCDDGDLLYAWSASFGPRIWQGGKVIYHYHIWKVLPTDRVDRDFLYYFFDWDKELIKKEQGAGATMIHVSKGSMEARAIPLPPLEEQQRIVAVLDEAFEGLDRARAHTEANLQNARELFENYRESILDASRKHGWSLRKLDDLVKIKHGFAFKSAFFVDQGQYAVLTPGNYHETGGFRDRGGKQRYYSGEFPSEFLLRKGDLLMAMTEQAPGLLGSCMIVPENESYLHNQRLGLITPKDAVVWSAEYFLQAFNLKAFRKGLSDTCSGATVRHTSPKRILAEAIPYSDNKAELEAAASDLAEREQDCRNLEKAYHEKIQDLDDLRQSLLQKAFAGELT